VPDRQKKDYTGASLNLDEASINFAIIYDEI